MDVVQFVDQIGAAPTVRLNLNNETPWGTTGVDFSPPPLKQAWAGTLLADGEKLTAAAYSNRRLKLALELITASQDASATALQALWRELNRPTNLLRYQPDGASFPVFFRTIRSSNNSVRDYPGGGPGALRTVEVEIDAEPFALGLKESLSQRTAGNNPATSGLYFDITAAEAKGDVETPLYLSFVATDLTPTPGTWSPGYGRRQSVIAVRRGGTPSQAPLVLQAESMGTTTDTALQPNDAAMSGAGQNFARTTFAATPSLAGRLTISAFPATPAVDVRGTYRVFARVRQTVGTDVIQMRMLYLLDSSEVYSDIRTLPGGTVLRWVDLGTVQFPLGYDPGTDGMSGAPLSVRGVEIDVFAARVSGTGSLDTDAFVFVPADDRYCAIRWPEYASPSSYVLDSGANQVYATGAGGVWAVVAEMEGLPPLISPGVSNRVVFLRDVGSETAAGDALSASVAVTPYYWPRYLTVRGS